ncbi:MAG: hypothetical protein U1E15_08155 [Hyphomicrobiales bacterium]
MLIGLLILGLELLFNGGGRLGRTLGLVRSVAPIMLKVKKAEAATSSTMPIIISFFRLPSALPLAAAGLKPGGGLISPVRPVAGSALGFFDRKDRPKSDDDFSPLALPAPGVTDPRMPFWPLAAWAARRAAAMKSPGRLLLGSMRCAGAAASGLKVRRSGEIGLRRHFKTRLQARPQRLVAGAASKPASGAASTKASPTTGATAAAATRWPAGRRFQFRELVDDLLQRLVNSFECFGLRWSAPSAAVRARHAGPAPRSISGEPASDTCWTGGHDAFGHAACGTFRHFFGPALLLFHGIEELVHGALDRLERGELPPGAADAAFRGDLVQAVFDFGDRRRGVPGAKWLR